MRKGYDFSRGIRGRVAGKRRHAPSRVSEDNAPLTKGQLRELQRRLTELKDPVRYLIDAGFSRGFALYYNVLDDVYAMNDSGYATLFKSRKVAEAVRKLLGPGARLVRCTTRRRKGIPVPVLNTRPGRRKTRVRD